MICSDTAIGADFRDVVWGMSMNQIKSTETLRLIEEHERRLVYTLRLSDLDTTLTYHFDEGILTQAEYHIVE
jgi:hypothetical protein